MPPATYTDRLDGLSTSTAIKAPCRVATTADIELTGLQSIDGVTVAAGDRVLVKDQADATENGIYLAYSSRWTRALDFDGSRDVVGGTLVHVTAGSINANLLFEVQGSGILIPGSDEIEFAAMPDGQSLQAILESTAGAAFVKGRGDYSIQQTLDAIGVFAANFSITADGDDIGPGIQRAIDQGFDVIFLRGQNWHRTPVTSDRVIQIWGNGWEEGDAPGEGTWLMYDDDGFDPFTYTGTAAAGFQMHGLAFWQEHPASAPGWTPTDYPYIINIEDTAGGCYLDQLFFCNINKWVKSHGAGRTSWGRILGTPLREGFNLDNALDACHGQVIHAWPFGYASDPDYGTRMGAFTVQNADLFVLARVDTPQLGDVFVLGCRSCIRITESASGIPSKITGGSFSADNCLFGIYDPEGIGAPDGAQGWDCDFASFRHQGLAPGLGTQLDGARFIYSSSDFVNVQIGTYFGEYHDQQDIESNGASFSLQIANFKSDFGNQDNGGYGRIKLTGSNAIVQIGNVDRQGTPAGPLNDPSSTSNITVAGSIIVKPGHSESDVREVKSSDGVEVGQSSKVVTTGLARQATNVIISPRTNLGGSGVSFMWEDQSARSATQITIRTNTNVATTAAFFDFIATCD